MTSGILVGQLVVLSYVYHVYSAVPESSVMSVRHLDSISNPFLGRNCGSVTTPNGDILALVPKSVTDKDVYWPGIDDNYARNTVCALPDCRSFPCQNGGTCTETQHGFQCTCTVQFYGPTCGKQVCPESWLYFQGSCYRHFRYQLEFYQALAYCREFSTETGQADLSSIHSQEEMDFVSRLCVFMMEVCLVRQWIGLYQPDPEIEGPFVWSDGTPVDYTFWREGEPNNGGNGRQDCVEVFMNSTRAGQKSWQDQICTKTRSYVCKILIDLQ